MSALTVGQKVYVRMPGTREHARVGILIRVTENMGMVKFPNGDERLIPLSKLR